MPIIGQPRSYHKKFKFVVEIDGIQSTVATGGTGFQKCSELSVEVAKVEYSEGGALIPDKSPGRLTYSDVTLERGATQSFEMYTWFKFVADGASNIGRKDDEYKRTMDIVQLDRDGNTLRRWRLYNAWPVKFVAGDWDNESDENLIEQVVLTYDFFELIQ